MQRPDAHAISTTDSPWTALLLFALVSAALVAIVVLGVVGDGAFDTERASQASEKTGPETGAVRTQPAPGHPGHTGRPRAVAE
jgi:hypothetical protein